jgi:hypothetical protein
VILLLFGIGLRFHLNGMIGMWRIVVPGALIQSPIFTCGACTSVALWLTGLVPPGVGHRRVGWDDGLRVIAYARSQSHYDMKRRCRPQEYEETIPQRGSLVW